MPLRTSRNENAGTLLPRCPKLRVDAKLLSDQFVVCVLVPKDEALAASAWEYMLTAAGTAAHEALQTYATHAPPVQARERLAGARSD